MEGRIAFDKCLRGLPSKPHLYYQPPASIEMKYPAIVYSLYAINNAPADDIAYKQRIGYQVVVIDEDPDSKIPEEVAALPYCRFDRAYVADGLNHTSFIVYY